MAERKFKAHANLCTLIHNTRKAKGMTLDEVSRAIGTTKGHLCDIEHGNHLSVSFVLVCKLADTLRIPMTHLKEAALTIDPPKQSERNMEADRHEDDTDNWW